MAISSELLETLVPVVVGVPVCVVAYLVGRGNLHLVNGLDAERVADRDALARRLSIRLWLLGLALLAFAPAFHWAGSDEGRRNAITIALVVVVDVLAIALVLAIVNARRNYRKPPARR